MVWRLDIKGYLRSKNRFIAIVPVWDDYNYKLKYRPINHVRIEGVAVEKSRFYEFDIAEWHPNNPFSTEKWMEAELALCTYKTEFGQYIEASRQAFAAFPYPCQYFFPVQQLIPLHYLGPKEYRDKDREKAIYGG